MYNQQEELNEIITDMDQIVDAAHKVDDKKKRKDRQETLSQQAIKDRKGIKTRTKQATAKKFKQDSLSVESRGTRDSKPERNKLYKEDQTDVENILISSPKSKQQDDANTARDDDAKGK